MTEKEILKEILLRVYNKGFKLKVFPKPDNSGWIPTYTKDELVKHIENGSFIYLKDFLFDIDFAKCFFGEEKWSEKRKPKNICGFNKCWRDIVTYTEKEFVHFYGGKALNELIELDKWENDIVEVYSYWEQDIISKGWEYHLKELSVLDDNERLKYLERYLNESKN